MEALFTSDELKRLELANPEGLGLAQVLELFRQRGVTIAEATFRKYVQLGLLPRSRRVGRKGKHRGSHGLYPATVVERITRVREALGAGVRIDALRHSDDLGVFLADDHHQLQLRLGKERCAAALIRPELSAAMLVRICRRIKADAGAVTPSGSPFVMRADEK